MQRIATVKRARPNASNSAGVQRAAQPLTESQAADVMWVYYRDNKAQLITDIKDYRESILVQLMAGHAAEQVFAPFVKPLEPAKPVRRAP